MSTPVVDRIDDWDQQSFAGGYAGLHELAAADFSGVVRAGGAELFMTRGTVVGVRRGDIEDFEDGDGTVYEAPSHALPLLAIMQQRNEEVRAKYYTEDTPISDVDQTLEDGGFTGYIELSENVLSGDYYLVYHKGHSMSVAWVGESEQLLTGDEAFETADDEVGIYKVRPADIQPIEIPDADGAAAGAAEAGDTAEEDAAAGGGESEDESQEAPAETEVSTDEAEPAAATADVQSGEATAQTSTGDSEPKEDAAAEPAGDASATDGASASGSRSQSSSSTGAQAPSGTGASTQSRTGNQSPAPSPEPEPSTERSTGPSGRSTQQGQQAGGSQGRAGGGSSEGTDSGRSTAHSRQSASGSDASHLETRAIPSLDPGRTQSPQRPSDKPPGGGSRGESGGGNGATGAAAGEGRGTAPEGRGAEPQRTQKQQPAQPEPEPTPDPTPDPTAEPEPRGADTAQEPSAEATERIESLEDEVDKKEEEIDRLESELADATEERDELAAELEDLREERDELAEEVERLETELEHLEEEFGAATDAERRMTPAEAIAGTNLFVDYESKGDATLEKAHNGAVNREDLAANLQIGIHTEFEEDAVSVGGQDFDEFLRGTLQHRFAEWLVADLLFEVRNTGHQDALTDLYDVIPKIRRVEFNGAVDVEYVQDGQEKQGRERFDVIFRHRMGDPLIVANLNDSREPATGKMMESLVQSGERVGQSEDSLASAFLVTSSFFESEALETVSEATQGGILSRDKRTSFVNLTRKAGYHLCLVAAREGNFHMEVPEL